MKTSFYQAWGKTRIREIGLTLMLVCLAAFFRQGVTLAQGTATPVSQRNIQAFALQVQTTGADSVPLPASQIPSAFTTTGRAATGSQSSSIKSRVQVDAPLNAPAASPADGHWIGTTSQGYPIEFDVVGGGMIVTTFRITYYLYASGMNCYGYQTSSQFDGPISVTNDQFLYYPPYATLFGQFSSATTAYGNFTTSYSTYYCNYYTGSLGWSARRAAPPDSFGKITPPTGTLNQPLNPTLSWQSALGATSYEYCIGSSSGNCDVVGWTSTGTNTSATPSNLNGNTTYYWQVRARNADGTTEADAGTWWNFSTLPCYTLTMGVSPGSSGTLVANPTPSCNGGTQYASGTNVSLTANPSSGYVFRDWSGDSSGSQNPVTVTMNGNQNVTANFSTAASMTWSKTFGGSGTEYANAIVPTNDGGVVAAGRATSYGAGGPDAWVFKLNALGNLVWQKTVGGSGNDNATSIAATSDGGYIVGGNTTSFGAGGADTWVFKLDGSGNLQWQKTFGGPSDDDATQVIQTSDGGYFVATHTNSYGAGGQDVWLLKLDSVGNLVWNQTWGNTDRDDVSSIVQTSDGGYIITGDTVTATGWYAWLLKLDSSGTPQWQKTYTTPSGIASLWPTSDGGYIGVGNFLDRSWDGWVIKLSAQGDVQWQKTYGGSLVEYFQSITATGDGNYLVSGYTSSYGAGDWDAWVLELNSSGSILWQKTYGGNAGDVAYPITRASDGTYFVAGWANSFGAGDADAWIIKMDPNGNVAGTCGIVATATGTARDSGAAVTGVTSTAGTAINPATDNSTASGMDSNAQLSGQCGSWSTTTTLTSEPNPAAFGQTVTFTATVAPVPTGGNVAFTDNGATISDCSAQLLNENGQAICSTAAFTVGLHSVMAIYSGYGNYNSSTGTLPGGQTVNPVPTIINFSPVFGPVDVSVTLTGTHLTSATAVRFNGASALFTVVSDTLIMTTVPIGATTGPISVTTPSGSATSPSSFTVTTSAPIMYAQSSATGAGDCSSWANACTLPTALTAAVSGQEIWVMQGVHQPTTTGDRTATFRLKSGVSVYGGFAGTETLRAQRNYTTNVTILSGDLNGNDNDHVRPDEPTRADNSYHVVTGSGTDSTANLDGFTVTGGNETHPISSGTCNGAGMVNTGGSPTLANVIFANNAAAFRGGGLCNYAASHPTLTHVTFRNNWAEAGGGMDDRHSSPSLTDVLFEANSATTGGGIYNEASNATLVNVTFSHNTASGYCGGVYNLGSSSLTLINVTLTGNSAAYGGGMCNLGRSNPVLINVTFVHNSAVNDGGGMYNFGNLVTEPGNPVVRNSILWGNTPNNISTVGGNNTATLYDSIVGGGCPVSSTCSNIITADPLLGELANYGGNTPTVPLLPNSSAIDTGNASHCSAQDQRGSDRVGTCDIGAFESQGYVLAMTGGNDQTTSINSSFTSPLQASITTNNVSEPVNGGIVIFTAPLSGASVITTTQTITVAGGEVLANEFANSTLGSYQVTAGASGANSVNFNLTNGKVNTTATLTSTPKVSVFGQRVIFTATVTATQGIPTGTVDFFDDTTPMGSATLESNGTAIFSVSALAVGTHPTITAHYGGDANHTNSTSSPYSQTVNQANTTIAVMSALNPTVFGQSAIFTATVSVTAPGAGTPTGTITFFDGVTNLGSLAVNGTGQATLSVSTLAAGVHPTITAQYSGDVNFTGSTASTYSHTVNQANTTIAVMSAPNPTVFGQSAIFTATVSVTAPGAGTPTGTITFFDGVTNLGSRAVNGTGQATFSVSTLAAGAHPTITAQYGGDANFTGSTSSAYSHTVNQATTATSVSSFPNPSRPGQAVTFTATVTSASGTPTGLVSFFDESLSLGSGALNASGVATFTTTSLAVGPHPTITASYGGSTNYASSTSNSYSHAVNKVNTVTSLTSSQAHSLYGQPITFTATVTSASGIPSGSVTFTLNALSVNVPLDVNAQGVYVASALTIGTYVVTATYSGDAVYLASSSVLNGGVTIEPAKVYLPLITRDFFSAPTSNGVAVDWLKSMSALVKTWLK